MKTQKQVPHIKRQNRIHRDCSVFDHILSLENVEHHYKLRLSKRAKNIRIQINQEGIIQLVLPFRLKQFDHLTFIRSKADWIKKHLTLTHADCFYYLGEKIKIIVFPNLFATSAEWSLIKNTLTVNIPADDQRNPKMIYNKWLYENALSYLPTRLRELAELHQFKPGRITIRKQKTRWGSCSRAGTISLNFKLLILKREIIDYILIHELCHLKEFNHSKEFWKLVEGILPHYRDFRKELRQIRIYN